jgi:hypothetical protein
MKIENGALVETNDEPAPPAEDDESIS